ncbi:hypothetical protein HDU96_010940 [Phlyctochytrium bullatum]|nr:hypothetical protein HDU96_010940 [Phlyctochytrium bullatum]
MASVHRTKLQVSTGQVRGEKSHLEYTVARAAPWTLEAEVLVGVAMVTVALEVTLVALAVAAVAATALVAVSARVLASPAAEMVMVSGVSTAAAVTVSAAAVFLACMQDALPVAKATLVAFRGDLYRDGHPAASDSVLGPGGVGLGRCRVAQTAPVHSSLRLRELGADAPVVSSASARSTGGTANGDSTSAGIGIGDRVGGVGGGGEVNRRRGRGKHWAHYIRGDAVGKRPPTLPRQAATAQRVKLGGGGGLGESPQPSKQEEYRGHHHPARQHFLHLGGPKTPPLAHWCLRPVPVRAPAPRASSAARVRMSSSRGLDELADRDHGAEANNENDGGWQEGGPTIAADEVLEEDGEDGPKQSRDVVHKPPTLLAAGQ